MTNAFKKYLFLINILLISGFANLYANSQIESTSLFSDNNHSNYFTQTPPKLLIDRILDISSNHQSDEKTLSEFVNEENFEDDENHKLNSDDYSFPINSSKTNICHARFLDCSNSKLQETNQRYIFNCSKTFIPLHITFQVFII